MNNLLFPEWTEQSSQLSISSSESNSVPHAESTYPAPAGGPSDPSSSSQKMAIPRLAERTESTYSSPGRFHRRHVSRACEACRQRKTKCTGDKNGCRNCREAGIICCYTDGKREKSKRQMASLEAKLEQYEFAFSMLSRYFNVSSEKLMSIASTMDPKSEHTSQLPSSFSIHNPTSFRIPEQSAAPTNLPLILEHAREDFNKDSETQATGFIGGSSEISWMQKIVRENGNGDYTSSSSEGTEAQPPASSAEISLSKLSYHLDDWELPSVANPSEFELPSKVAAKHLYQTYVESVHASFPIIGTSTFGAQFHSYYSNRNLHPGHKWLTILNLIFAIAAKYSYMIGESPEEYEIDPHHVYFSRARALGIDERGFDHLDLQQLQIEGLVALYLLALGQINRSWKVCGNAVRGAVSLGLHLRNIVPSTSDTSKEIRYRVWWSLYAMEHRLSVMTGRPSCICDSAFTTPLPVPFDEDDFKFEEVKRIMSRSGGNSNQQGRVSNSLIDPEINQPDIGLQGSRLAAISPRGSLYFLRVLQLASISRKMMSKLYSPEGTQVSHASKEFIIRGLMIELDAWCMDLPKEYDFTSTSTATNTPLSLANQRTSLALLYYSTRIGITRPFLENSNSANGNDPNIKSSEFYQKTAVECVEAACHLLRLFPEPPDAAVLYKVSPWWCVLHFLMQATAVIYIELAYHCQHVPEKSEMVKNAAAKSFEWLLTMAKTSHSSRKARRLCERLLDILGLRQEIGHDLDTLSDEDFQSESKGNNKTERGESSSSTFRSKNSSESASSSEVDPPDDVLDLMQTDRPPIPHNPYEDGYLPYDPSTGQLTGSLFPGEGSPSDFNIGYYWNADPHE